MFIEKFLDDLGVPGIVMLGIVGVSLLLYIISKISSMVVKKKLNPLAEMLNAEVKSSFLGGTYLNILNYGPEIHLKLTLGGKDNPSVLFLELLNPVGFRFKIVKKQALNQMFSLWGEEVELEESPYKEDLLVRSDKPSEASSYLMNSRRVEAVKYFFGNGFNRIEANARGVYISKMNYTNEDLAPGQVGTYLDNLNSFTRM